MTTWISRPAIYPHNIVLLQIKRSVFWNTMQYRSLNINRRFRRTYHLSHPEDVGETVVLNVDCLSMVHTSVYPWRFNFFITIPKTSTPTTDQFGNYCQQFCKLKGLITTTPNREIHNFAIVVPSAAEELWITLLRSFSEITKMSSPPKMLLQKSTLSFLIS
jgi:hypothetical protein